MSSSRSHAQVQHHPSSSEVGGVHRVEPAILTTLFPTVCEATISLTRLTAWSITTLADTAGATWTPNGRDAIASRLKSSSEEVLVSFDNLEKLKCIAFVGGPPINPGMAPLGRLLMKAVHD